MEQEQFTEEEITRLKELAQNMEAYSRVGRTARAGLIWIAGIITAWWVVWEGIIKHFVWKG